MGERFQRRSDTDPPAVPAAPQGEMDALLLGRTKELSTFDPDGRNWRGIFLSLLVIAAVCSLILMAIILLSPVPCDNLKSARLTLDDLTSETFLPYDFNATWISGHELVYQDHEETLVLFNVETLTKTILLSNVTFRQNHVQRCKLSADKRYLLLMSNLQRTTAARWEAEYKIYNLKSQILGPIPFDSPANRISLVEWGPVGNQMIFIRDNDLYYVTSVGSKAYHLSVSSNPNIFNGILNWFYREKVMEIDQGIWWLADGSKLAYVIIDESLVNDTNYLYYGGMLYPKVLNMKYPRPGGALPIATIWVQSLPTMPCTLELCQLKHSPRQIQPPKEIQHEGYLYLTGVCWIDGTRLIVNWSPRSQSKSWVTLCTLLHHSWICVKLVEIIAKSKHSWTEFIGSPILSMDAQKVFVLLPRETTLLDSFRHVAMVPFEFQNEPTFVTNGSSDVAEFLTDDVDGNIFFTKVLEERPEQTHLFSRNIRGGLAGTKCLTCVMNNCGVIHAIFSPNAKYYILICLGPDVPKLEVWSVELEEHVFILDSYAEIRNAWRRKSSPFVQHLKVPLQEQFHTIVKTLKPTKHEPEDGTKFPLLLFAEDGLGSRSRNHFEIGLPEYFSATRHYFVAVMDGTFRGARLLGNRMLHSADFRVSDSGAEDIALVVRYLVKTFPFIDSSRVGIYSRGLAAFWTIRVLNDFYSPFACGVTVAPLVSWRFADALTSERYLGNPSTASGQERYENSELPNPFSLSNKMFLLIHGTADQDIPVFNSMLLMKKLASEGAKYRSQIYPDENHRLTGTIRHFYHTLDDFFEQCFRVEVEDTSIHILPGFKKSKIMIAG